MIKHPSAQSFINIPSYPSPAGDSAKDLTSLGQRLRLGCYINVTQFLTDGRKIWDKAKTINKPGTRPYAAATEMGNYFEELSKGLTQHSGVPKPSKPKQDIKRPVPKEKSIIPMTINEKTLLKQNIMQLPRDKMAGLVTIIQSAVDTTKSKESLEFDIDKLPVKLCRELEQYVSNCLKKKPVVKEPTISTYTQPVKVYI